MTEEAFLQILRVLIVVFPPFAELLARFLPVDDEEPLVARIREILPLEGASARARRTLEWPRALDEDDEPTNPGGEL